MDDGSGVVLQHGIHVSESEVDASMHIQVVSQHGSEVVLQHGIHVSESGVNGEMIAYSIL